MSRKDANESTEPLVGRLGAAVWRTARAARISRHAVKSGCAWEWGGWGQLSDDGPGQHNPDRRAPGVEQPGCSHGGAPAYRDPRLRTRT